METRIDNRALRASCQCALCINEFTGEPILDPTTIPNDLRVEGIQPLGNYAVAITWSDGHSSGIFSWEHMKKSPGWPRPAPGRAFAFADGGGACLAAGKVRAYVAASQKKGSGFSLSRLTRNA